MAIPITGTFKPLGDFPLVEATDIEMPDGSRLSDFKPNVELTEEQIAALKGKDGVDGKDGYTPVKGVDYFDGKDGTDGKNGVDGHTPVKGVDYFTEEELQLYMGQIMSQVDTRIDNYLREALEGDY